MSRRKCTKNRTTPIYTMTLLLSHTVALVTGGSSGLGAATVKYLIQQGARVVVADLNVSSLPTAADAGKHSTRLVGYETNVTDEGQVSQALDLAETTFGEPINVAINCAGMALVGKTFSRNKGPHDLASFMQTLHVNAVGSFNVARLAAERMSKRDLDANNLRGCIVNTASIAAYEGQIGQVAYAASKGAIVGMTLPMARELAPYGIRVMTIAPGLFATPLLDGLPEAVKLELGATVPCPSRLGDPTEFAQLVGSILTIPTLNGSVIRLDGALRMPP